MNTSPGTVFVVDDDTSMRKALIRLCHISGLTVRTFASAREFLDTGVCESPACLVLDVQMPDMTGLQVQEQLTAQGCSVPIVFVTAFDSPQTWDHAQRTGVVGLLLKPFAQHEFLNLIQEAVKRQP